ncbi:uncharacterized protein UHOD_11321 [Ustilago sp. UG-2017b]|nr:uncharacterized protein UHOD_11321 [Ustilago sp. UG-2017b]
MTSNLLASCASGPMRPTRNKPSGSFHRSQSKKAHLVDLTDINWKHQIWFQARDRLHIVSHIVKLNENNWAIWEPMFMDCIHPIKNTKHILTGEIPSGHADYDEELDSHLLGLILSSCDHRPDSRINTYTVREQGEEEQLGSTLYKKLNATLTINNKVKLSTIHDRVHEIKLVNCNIVNLGKALDRIWNDAARLGVTGLDAQKDWTYMRSVVHTNQGIGQVVGFNRVCQDRWKRDLMTELVKIGGRGTV